MKRHALFLALALGWTLAPRVSSGAETGAGRLRFESERCDLGALIQGERPACDFVLSNTGSGDLRILEIEPSCGCTTALPPPPVLRPGERGRIRLTFDSSAFSGDVLKTTVVRSSDPVRPETTLEIAAHIETEIEFEPRQVNFDNAASGITSRATIVFVNRRAEPVEIRSIASRPASFACRLPVWKDPGLPLLVESWDRVVLEVEVTPPPTFSMPLAGECTLAIRGPRKSDFTVRLIARPSK